MLYAFVKVMKDGDGINLLSTYYQVLTVLSAISFDPDSTSL